MRCETCGGTGTVKIARAYPVRVCWACHGSGSASRGEGMVGGPGEATNGTSNAPHPSGNRGDGKSNSGGLPPRANGAG